MTNGRLTRQRKKQLWSYGAWMSTGTASFVFWQQQRYGSALFFGVLAVGFGAIHLGATIHRRRQVKRAAQERLEKQKSRSTNKRARASRPTVKTRFRNNLEMGVLAAAARKPVLDTEYRDAEKERREGKERIPVG
jgi:hypothetical protein